MKVPINISLSEYIIQLIKKGKVVEFYQTDEWKDLRQEVLEEFFYECQECLKKGKYTRADCVHHVNEVKKRPDLALSKFYIDKHGNRKRQLLPLCNACHNIEHDRLGNWIKERKFQNEERW